MRGALAASRQMGHMNGVKNAVNHKTSACIRRRAFLTVSQLAIRTYFNLLNPEKGDRLNHLLKDSCAFQVDLPHDETGSKQKHRLGALRRRGTNRMAFSWGLVLGRVIRLQLGPSARLQLYSPKNILRGAALMF